MNRYLIDSYTNGNYNVFLYSDGTKIRLGDDTFKPQFPESIDMKISNCCDMGCPFCHERSVPNGELANLMHPLLDSLPQGTELALGGGNVFEHPDLVPFLRRMSKQGVICNMTVHVKHFEWNYELIKLLVDSKLIYGLGISVTDYITDTQIALIQSIPNAVIHCIAGIAPIELFQQLGHKNLKLLILGYKHYGRGENYFEKNTFIKEQINKFHYFLPELYLMFPIISFDNLAIWQLHLNETIDEGTWNRSYMGNDGEFTMYIDLVKEEFAASSISPRQPIDKCDNIITLFDKVKS